MILFWVPSMVGCVGLAELVRAVVQVRVTPSGQHGFPFTADGSFHGGRKIASGQRQLLT
jgi:hypothetical protein